MTGGRRFRQDSGDLELIGIKSDPADAPLVGLVLAKPDTIDDRILEIGENPEAFVGPDG